MANWIWLLVSISFVGNSSDRTILHFSSQNCPACRKIQPVIDQLNSDGWAIRSIDSVKDQSTADQWRVHQIPTVIILENGREVDRVIGSVENVELKRRLTGNAMPKRASKPTRISSSKVASPVSDSNYGPNHPLYKANISSDYGPNHPLFQSNRTSENDLAQSIGINHPYYSKYKQPRIASRVAGKKSTQPSRTAQPSRMAQRQPTGLPASPESLSATVRIRVQYEESESVGTGTIIDVEGDEVLVLTCGHLFRNSEGQRPMTVELFEEGEPIPVPASLFDFRDDEVDLGLVKFHQPYPVSRVPILPKGETLHEQDSVFSIGCDIGDEPSRRDTVITKLNRFLGPSNIEIAGAPVQGRSGGGLFDARGRLIGICIAADNDLDEGMFVGPEAIYAQLEKHQLNRLFDASQ